MRRLCAAAPCSVHCDAKCGLRRPLGGPDMTLKQARFKCPPMEPGKLAAAITGNITKASASLRSHHPTRTSQDLKDRIQRRVGGIGGRRHPLQETAISEGAPQIVEERRECNVTDGWARSTAFGRSSGKKGHFKGRWPHDRNKAGGPAACLAAASTNRGVAQLGKDKRSSRSRSTAGASSAINRRTGRDRLGRRQGVRDFPAPRRDCSRMGPLGRAVIYRVGGARAGRRIMAFRGFIDGHRPSTKRRDSFWRPFTIGRRRAGNEGPGRNGQGSAWSTAAGLGCGRDRDLRL